VIRIARNGDLDAACARALGAAKEVAGADAACRCSVVRIEADDAVLELHCAATGALAPEAMRSRLLSALAARFAAAGGPEGARAATFT
jgi:hypothetical protein